MVNNVYLHFCDISVYNLFKCLLFWKSQHITCAMVDQIDIVGGVVESAALDNLTLVEITAAALTVTGVLKIPTNFLT